MSNSAIVNTARRRVRSGVRAFKCENRLVSRYVFNAGAVRSFRRRPPQLAPGATQVVNELRQAGVALSSVRQVVGQEDTLAELQAYAQLLRSEPIRRDPAKPFLTELLGSSPLLEPGNPLLALALHPQVRGIAESYSRLRLEVQDINIWVNMPTPDAPSQSQRWHRDLPEDYDIVKCFVYLADVPDGAGPLQYVRESNTRQGRKRKFEAEFDGIGYRMAERDVDIAFGPDQIVTARGTAGTMVFADTRGIHRGGFAVDAERVVAQITYASLACDRPLNLRPGPGVDRKALGSVRLAS